VKICSLYGAGFYYIPGTDMCLKIGGWVRQYLGAGSNNSFTNGAFGTNGNTATNASNNGFGWKVRGYITADSRNQTEYGTVRGYIAVGTSIQGTNGGQGASGASGVNTGGVNVNRAFIQFAGFTFGVSQSFYDLFPTPALSYFGGMANPSSDTSDGGQTVTAYTAQFGNGMSASIAAEAPRTTAVFGQGSAAQAIASTGAIGVNDAIAVRYPDVVANLRVEGAWGAAQVMGAIHDASGTYYGATTATGNPNYATGWVVGGGIKLFAPMIGAGDYFSAQVNYSQGAYGYVNDGATLAAPGAGGTGNTAAGSYAMFNGSGGVGLGVITDGVYGLAGSSVQLTTVWGVNAGYEHFWSKSFQTSVYGTYTATSYNATANASLCAVEVASTFAAVAGGTCTNNFQYWTVGSRSQWNVDSQTYIGVDVIYQKLQTALAGESGSTIAANGYQPAAVRAINNQSAIVVQARVHRNFYP
jgi:porin-like protein